MPPGLSPTLSWSSVRFGWLPQPSSAPFTNWPFFQTNSVPGCRFFTISWASSTEITTCYARVSFFELVTEIFLLSIVFPAISAEGGLIQFGRVLWFLLIRLARWIICESRLEALTLERKSCLWREDSFFLQLKPIRFLDKFNTYFGTIHTASAKQRRDSDAIPTSTNDSNLAP